MGRPVPLWAIAFTCHSERGPDLSRRSREAEPEGSDEESGREGWSVLATPPRSLVGTLRVPRSG